MTAPSLSVPAPSRRRAGAAHPAVEHRPRLRPWVVFTLAVIVAFFGLIYSRISLDRSAFELEELEDRIAHEERRLLDLEVEVARLQDPARVNARGVELGMVYPASRVGLEAPAPRSDDIDPDLRWAQLKALLSAQP